MIPRPVVFFAAGLLLAALLTGVRPVAAQAPADSAGSAGVSEGEAAEEPRGGSALIPIPILFYTPETKWAYGGSILYLFGGDEPGTEGRPSTLSAVGIYTQKKQSIFGAGGNLLLDGGRTEITAGAFYQNFPSNFYGVGNETPSSGVEDYTPRQTELMFRGTRRVRGAFQVGVTAQAAHLDVREVEAGGVLDQGLLPGIEGGWVVGLGVLAGLDSRDAVFSAGRGLFAELGLNVYESVLGSDYSYTGLSGDFRYYQPVFARHVLAARLLGIFNLGHTPFQRMPQLGGRELLRGYYEGRFRDRELVAVQTEYRFPVYKRLGLAVFGSAGQVARSAPGLRVNDFHLAGGAGARFILSRESRFVMRMDWGFGEEDNGFYFSFGEAF